MFVQMPSLTGLTRQVVGRGIWVLPMSTSCRKFSLTSREKRPPQVANVWLR